MPVMLNDRVRSDRENQEAEQLRKELEDQKKIKRINRHHKDLDKLVDHTGQVWDARHNRWAPNVTTQPISKETHMAKKAKTAKKPAKATKAKTTAKKVVIAKTSKSKSNGHHAPREGSKLEVIRDMLTRPKGCTTADLLKATGWPAISVPEQCRKLGLTMRSEKIKKGSDRPRTVYHAS
jgi:hypothetical protein